MKRTTVSEEVLLNLLEDKLKAEGYPECKFLKLPPMPGGVGDSECNWSTPIMSCGENLSSAAFLHIKNVIETAQAKYNVDYSARSRRAR
jgi:hypothetical protein